MILDEEGKAALQQYLDFGGNFCRYLLGFRTACEVRYSMVERSVDPAGPL